MRYGKNRTLIGNARSLRKNMTKEERHLWYDFLRYCHPRFRRQEIISNYIIDFFCHEAKIAVELDGSQHCEPDAIAYDAKRTAHLQSLGIQLIRYANTEINSNFDGVCQHILLMLEAKGFHPSVTCGDSSPEGEPCLPPLKGSLDCH